MNSLIGHDSATKSRKAWIRKLVVRSKELWGNNKNHRRQWIHKTVDLHDRGLHLLCTSKFKYKY